MAITRGLKVNLGLVIFKCQAVIFFCAVFTWIEDDSLHNFKFQLPMQNVFNFVCHYKMTTSLFSDYLLGNYSRFVFW